MTGAIRIRAGRPSDAPVLRAMIEADRDAAHLLPRTLADLRAHASRFSIAILDGQIVGGAELAPLAAHLGEVRSLVVAASYRGHGVGTRLIESVKARAAMAGLQTLCAFTHDPAPFIRWAFRIAPHAALPEKIAADCRACALFGSCGQYAVVCPIAARRARRASAAAFVAEVA